MKLEYIKSKTSEQFHTEQELINICSQKTVIAINKNKTCASFVAYNKGNIMSERWLIYTPQDCFPTVRSIYHSFNELIENYTLHAFSNNELINIITKNE